RPRSVDLHRLRADGDACHRAGPFAVLLPELGHRRRTAGQVVKLLDRPHRLFERRVGEVELLLGFVVEVDAPRRAVDEGIGARGASGGSMPSCWMALPFITVRRLCHSSNSSQVAGSLVGSRPCFPSSSSFAASPQRMNPSTAGMPKVLPL